MGARRPAKTGKPKRITTPRRVDPDEIDPFAFDPTIIPKKSAYQWVALSVMGDGRVAQMFPNWKPVPYRRHAKVFPKRANVKNRIVIGDMMLVERPRADVETELARVTTDSIAMEQRDAFVDYPYLIGKVANRDVYPQHLWAGAIPTEAYQSDTEPKTVDITIKLWLSGRQVDAAAALHIPPTEYAQRVVTMMANEDWNMPGFLLPKGDGRYETFDRIMIARGPA